MASILDRLAGGDLRSIGLASQAAAEAAGDPALLTELAHGLEDPDPRVSMRATDALEKATAAHPQDLQPFAGQILNLAGRTTRKEIRWHMAQMIPRLALDDAQVDRAAAILYAWLDDSSRIVVTFSLQALSDLALSHPRLLADFLPRLELFTRSPYGSVRSRALRLYAQCSRLGKELPA